MKPKAEPLAYTQAQAAAAIGVTDRTIRRWEIAGLLKGHRPRKGGPKFYPRAALLALVTGEQAQAENPERLTA